MDWVRSRTGLHQRDDLIEHPAETVTDFRGRLLIIGDQLDTRREGHAQDTAVIKGGRIEGE